MTKREALAKVYAGGHKARDTRWAHDHSWIYIVNGKLCFEDRGGLISYGAAHLFLDEGGWQIREKK